MKYLTIVLDGLSETESLTTLQQANTPNLDKIYQMSKIGLVNCVKDGFAVASDVANMAILGYDPNLYYSGRAYLEAKANNVQLKEDEIVYRANIVELSDEDNYREKTMLDFTASNIDSINAYKLIDDLNRTINDESYLVKGSFYHHLFVTKNKEVFDIAPPHEIMNSPIKQYLDDIDETNYFFQLMKASTKIIDNRYNATSLWLWSRSEVIQWPSFRELYHKKGAMISAVDALIGIAKLAELDYINVEGATGDHKTSYSNKIDKTISLLNNGYDYVFLHIEACDYCSHQGDQLNKIAAIEAIDRQVISKVLDYDNDIRVLILPDHHTSTKTKMHEAGHVPVMLYDNTMKNIKRTGTYKEDSFREEDELEVLTLIEQLLKDKE